MCATGYKRIHVGKDCESGAELDLGAGKASFEACGAACTAAKGAGCKYFAFGTGSKAGRCYWEESCSATKSNGYDVYQPTLTGYTITLASPATKQHLSTIESVGGERIDLRCEVGLVSRNVVFQGSDSGCTPGDIG